MTVHQQQSIADELEKARALSKIITRYIEEEYSEDAALITVMIDLTDKIHDCIGTARKRSLMSA